MGACDVLSACPLLLATWETHCPMPCVVPVVSDALVVSEAVVEVDDALSAALHAATAAVTASP